jgi:hypothetical protein
MSRAAATRYAPRVPRLALLAVALVVACSSPARRAPTVPAAPPPQAIAPAGTAQRLAELEATYRIDVLTEAPAAPVATAHGLITALTAAPAELDAYAPLLSAEMSLYPPELVAASRLVAVVLCRELAFAGQLRNAVPDFEHGTLYLEVSRGSYSRAYLQKTFHHEFFHVVDYEDDGVVYADAAWEAMNPPGFHYGSGGVNAQDIATTSLLTTAYPGFLNHYSTTAVEEDKAEIFANLIVADDYVESLERTDAVVHAKVERMKELLVSFTPAMNDAFWQRVDAVPR